MINFVVEDRKFSFKKALLKSYLKDLVISEGKKCGDISIVLCSDEYLLNVNNEYLKHDFYTDIITFDYSVGLLISGDLMISIDRICENASTNKVESLVEFYRVCFHGVLHLCGFKDKTKADKELMTSKENFYLNKFNLT
ncbi:MAG: rRNA maturation RNase YbeY [Flavobacteriia bacterium]|jgi:probable rRNA maturation factor